MRVLHVLGNLNRGGAETFVMNLYRNIDRSQVQFDFVIHTEMRGAYAGEIESLGGRIYCVPKFKGRNLYAYLSAWRLLFKQHSEWQIVHGHVRSTAVLYLTIAKKYGLFTISHSHSTSTGRGISAMVKSIMQFPIRYIAEYLLACSEQAGIWLFGKNTEFHVIKNPIDAAKFKYNKDVRDRIRRELHIGDKFIVGHVGNFTFPKNHQFILEVFTQVVREKPESRLILVGAGELQENIKKAVKLNQLDDKVLFLGECDRVEEVLQGFDIFLFPSLWEGFSLSTIEAVCAGLSCVVSDVLPVEVKSLKNVHSISLSAGCEEWSEKVMELQDVYRDQTAHEELINDGFDIKAAAEEMQELYLRFKCRQKAAGGSQCANTST